jgi:glycolate oxidase FAD binding subunit
VDLTRDALAAFAEQVGDSGPVTVVGGRTQWGVGGEPDAAARELAAPEGIVRIEPAEMTARVRAGTRLATLVDALAEVGQRVLVAGPPTASLGGLLSVGHSDVHRLGRGPLRDAVLEVVYVSAGGQLVKGGGPTVKNVSGYDLPRLFVGSLGTLGCLAEVVLRTRPEPEAVRWYTTNADPFVLRHDLYTATAVLWDGTSTWVALEGAEDEIASTADGRDLLPADGPPELPPHRWSLDPAELHDLAERSAADTAVGSFVAEVGVGVVHASREPAPAVLAPRLRELHDRVKRVFDPAGRLNPGRDVLT